MAVTVAVTVACSWKAIPRLRTGQERREVWTFRHTPIGVTVGVFLRQSRHKLVAAFRYPCRRIVVVTGVTAVWLVRRANVGNVIVDLAGRHAGWVGIRLSEGRTLTESLGWLAWLRWDVSALARLRCLGFPRS